MQRLKTIPGRDFEWSKQSWTHNVFRFYEMIFGRRFGIKAEMSSWNDTDGTTHYACHSIESVFALTETYVRNYLASWKFVPFKIHVPILQTPTGFPVPASPYLFAIAYDSVSNGVTSGAGTTNTVSHTCTGSNLILWSAAYVNKDPPPGITSITYNGAGMTVTASSPAFDGHASNKVRVYLYWLAGPSTGANNLVMTVAGASNDRVNYNTSYSGAKQTGIPDADSKTENTSATTSTTLTVTTVADNCWLVGGFRNEIGGAAAGTNTTIRFNNGDAGIGDTNAAQTPAGSKSIQMTFSSSVNCGVVASFAPVATSVTLSVTDSTAESDTPTVKTILQGVSPTDSSATSDTATLSQTSFINATDSTAIGETVTVKEFSYINVSDSTAVSEVVTVRTFSFVNVTDTTAVSDTATISITSSINVSDISAVSDTITMSGTEYVNVTDSTAVTDTATIFIPTYYISVSDSTAVSDTASILVGATGFSMTDTTAVSDTATVLIPTNYISVSETTAVSDTVTVAVSAPQVTVTDSTAITESVAISISGTTTKGYSFVVFID